VESSSSWFTISYGWVTIGSKEIINGILEVLKLIWWNHLTGSSSSLNCFFFIFKKLIWKKRLCNKWSLWKIYYVYSTYVDEDERAADSSTILVLSLTRSQSPYFICTSVNLHAFCLSHITKKCICTLKQNTKIKYSFSFITPWLIPSIVESGVRHHNPIVNCHLMLLYTGMFIRDTDPQWY
jgi:hypothetical protein